MSKHNFPFHNAKMGILKRRDLSELEKQERIRKLDKAHAKFLKEKNKR